jgi:hypothetical protein
MAVNGAVKVEGIQLVANRPSVQLQTLSSYSKFHSRTSRPRNVVKTSLRTTKSQQIKRSFYALVRITLHKGKNQDYLNAVSAATLTCVCASEPYIHGFVPSRRVSRSSRESAPRPSQNSRCFCWEPKMI